MSNGYYYNHAYNETTDSTPSWADHILHVGDNVQDIIRWGRNTSARAAVVTDEGVEVINLYNHSSVMYATKTSGFNSVQRYNTGSYVYLYLGTASGGVFKIAITDEYGVELSGDITPGAWTAEYDTSSSPALTSNNITDLLIYESNGLLAVVNGYRLSIIDISAATVVHSKYATTEWTDVSAVYYEKLFKVVGTADTACYASGGGLIYWFSDVTSLSNNFEPDNFYGQIEDDFDDNDFDDFKWFNATSGGSSVTEQNQQLEHYVLPGGIAASTNSRFVLPPDQDFDIQVDFSNFWKDASGSTTAVFRIAINDYSKYLSIYRYYYSTTDRVYSDCENGTGNNQVYTSATATSGKLRIIYDSTNHTITSKWYDGSSWTTLHNAYSWDPGSNTIHCTIRTISDAGSAHTMYWDNFTENTPPANRGTDFPGAGKSVTGGVVTVDTSSNSTNTLFTCYNNSGGLRVIDTDESTPGSSEDGCSVYGGSWETSSLTATCVSVDEDSDYNSGYSYIGTSSGITVVDNSSGEIVFTHDSSGSTYDDGGGAENRNQPLIDDDVTCLVVDYYYPTPYIPQPYKYYILYGSSAGAGFLYPDSEPPSDAAAYAEPFNSNYVLTGTIKPSAIDYLDTSLQMRKNGGTWQTLKTDGWGGSGSTVRFTPDEQGQLAYLDYSSLDDGKYEFRWIHRDEAYNESSGATADAVYLDEPVITSFQINSGSATTTDRGVTLTVTADSGDDSGNEDDQVYFVQFKESGEAWGTHPKQLYSNGANYPFRLSSGSGTKIVYCRGLSKSGKAGSAVSATIVYNESTGTTATSTDNNCIFFYRFDSDLASIAAQNEDSDFPVENVRDDRIGVYFKADAADTNTTITYDFSTTKFIRVVAILGHNFASRPDSASFSLTINYGNGITYDYVTFDSDIMNEDPIIWRPNPVDNEFTGVLAHRFWYINMSGTGWGTWRPQIGRVIMSETCWQPEKNFADTWSLNRKDPSKVIFSEARSITNIELDQYDVAAIQFNLAPETLQDNARSLFEQTGLTEPVLVLLDPTKTPYGRQSTTPYKPYGELASNPLAIYGYFESELSLQRGPRQYGTVKMKIREIVT